MVAVVCLPTSNPRRSNPDSGDGVLLTSKRCVLFGRLAHAVTTLGLLASQRGEIRPPPHLYPGHFATGNEYALKKQISNLDNVLPRPLSGETREVFVIRVYQR